MNAAVSNVNQMVAEINAGKGAMGMLAKDPAFAAKLDDTVNKLDLILKGMNEGKGTLGQLVQNRSLYDHTDQTMDQAQQLVKSIREDPKKYFVIRLKAF
jgi:phospholipid/cholesterol/gamma-HCH transport system substrate-binding protein